MRDLLLQRLPPERPAAERRHHLREMLQIILLKILHESSDGTALAFTGDTALRLLHGLPRFSEDLDFSLIRPKKYEFDRLAKHVQTSLAKLALVADFKAKSEKNVQHLYVQFRGLLQDAGLSAQAGQKLPIRLEIDTNPPGGWQTAVALLSGFQTFPVLHFDLPSSFATKLHACLYRHYAKGRDFYDLVWYLGKKIRPNLAVLNEAIAQTQATPAAFDARLLQKALLRRLAALDEKQLQQEVAPFLIHPEELKLLEFELMQQVVKGYEF